ncbi:hypothetical protein A2V56_05595 [Candidatus Woesebacteria bacterium RBG_19FT_COMBO_42_9]|uniref:Uncharacterized protein n=1 Tax=Candidatus Woesebacteria bacterium RBG_16_42_24 TaxID=1802485 RepID=A0A1F7XL39_9BACT|nr:MAG: hypothetical protein A2V97_02925 [Candidatus Woesebacteria bacterium RBG_16_42_24]OGM16087.1 MAG: hypothetical protein A2V56_05595 [Candidatus Woesebacteria bacterium RBG_19FT_COMBO_42_9]OGM68384.1 MAG: hypothetical protein A2985_01035 [Candidatus Woesebacteria bacterium RIFCSPLOWO2_01_FULL_43_11]
MGKELVRHSVSALILLVLVTLLKGWLDLSVWPLWVGGIVGTILPDIDHLLYIYLNPQELTSQRTVYMAGQGKVLETLKFLAETRSERKNLIFHTFLFQAIFLILAVFVLTSSGSLFGRGLVLAFYLHLLVDAYIDWKETGGMENWLKNSPIAIPQDKIAAYFIVNIILLAFLAIFL